MRSKLLWWLWPPSGREWVSEGAIHDLQQPARPSLTAGLTIDVHDKVTRSRLSSSEPLDETGRIDRIKAPKGSVEPIGPWNSQF